MFLHANFADQMVHLLARYRAEGRFLLHGFVVMPDHMHVLFSPEKSLEATVGLLKGGFSFAVRKQWRGLIWQDGYYPHRVMNSRDYDAQMLYIAATRNGGVTRTIRIDMLPIPNCLTRDRIISAAEAAEQVHGDLSRRLKPPGACTVTYLGG